MTLMSIGLPARITVMRTVSPARCFSTSASSQGDRPRGDIDVHRRSTATMRSADSWSIDRRMILGTICSTCMRIGWMPACSAGPPSARSRTSRPPRPDIPGSAINGPSGGLDSRDVVADNRSMEIQGRVHNGVVVLDRELSLPEGTVVTVVYPASPATNAPDSGQRLRLPLVRSDRPSKPSILFVGSLRS